MRQKERYERVLGWFRENNPGAQTELHYNTPFELLVAVMLSAQCTDKRINQVTPALFRDYPTAEAMAAAGEDVLFEYIKSVSYPRNKARHLKAMAQMLLDRFGGEIPRERDRIEELPGVGRKTANVIASIVYGGAYMAVDTHVFRVAERIGLTTRSKSPKQTEDVLTRHIPKAEIGRAHHWLILHGRYVCEARKPKCEACGIAAFCRYHARRTKTEKHDENGVVQGEK